VPALHLENMADMVLTEENPYSEIFPEMFSPHVHFLNVALLANLSDEAQTIDWAILMNGGKVTGTTKIQPVSFVTFPIQVPVKSVTVFGQRSLYFSCGKSTGASICSNSPG